MQSNAKLLGAPKLTIAMLAYPGMYLQDLVGLLTMFEALMRRAATFIWFEKRLSGFAPCRVFPSTGRRREKQP
jgi:hypothetical protein